MSRQFENLSRTSKWRYINRVDSESSRWRSATENNTTISTSTTSDGGHSERHTGNCGVQYLNVQDDTIHSDYDDDSQNMCKSSDYDFDHDIDNRDNENMNVEEFVAFSEYNANIPGNNISVDYINSVYTSSDVDEYDDTSLDIDEVSIRDGENLNSSDEMDDDAPQNYDDIFYNQPIYEGAPISVHDSMLLLLNLSLKHNITDSCLSDILFVVNKHCLQKNLKKTSLYQFQKYFKSKKQTMTKNYYCTYCKKAMNDPTGALCDGCNRSNHIKYFITMSIIDQIKLILCKKNVYSSLKTRFDRKTNDSFVEELYDGSLYNSQNMKTFTSNSDNLTFTWCSDGVPVFSSTKVGIWPFYLRINELPYNIRTRRENTILAGLWFGSDKPIPNMFLKALTTELEILYNGIDVRLPNMPSKLKIRALCLCGTCDLPAKAMFMNFSQYNSIYGCPNCEQQTIRVPITSGGSVSVFKLVNNPVPRQLSQTLEHARQALEKKIETNNPKEKTSVIGVKGPSQLSLIMPDYVAGVAIDSMHACFEGLAKKLLRLWFDPQFSCCSFSLRKVVVEIDNLLLQIKPPKFIHRRPCSLLKFHNWKASELKCWFFYYSVPILKLFMKTELFHNYLRIVYAISVLNSNSISQTDIEEAEYHIIKFVEEFSSDQFYGIHHCSINIHQLLHLAERVRTLGPLWVHSCFTFEDMNGKLVRSIHGTTNIETQVAKSYWRMLIFSAKIADLNDGNLFSDLMLHGKKQMKIIQPIDKSCYSIGSYKVLDNIPQEIFEFISKESISGTIRQYHRILKNDLIYASESYEKELKSKSSAVQYFYNENVFFGKILYFVKISQCCCSGNKCLCDGNHFAVVNRIQCKLSFVTGDLNHEIVIPHIYEGVNTNSILLVPSFSLITPCIVIFNNEKLFLCTPVNKFEVE